MSSKDVMPSIDTALKFAGLNKKTAPKILSDNGKCYISSELREFFKDRGIKGINGKPCHPQTQGKIERYHRTMKNIVKLDNYYSPGELIKSIGEFVDYYNNKRYHESINNLTPADVYFGRDKIILEDRKKTKVRTLKERRKEYIFKRLILSYETI
jgi:transposase InsO family protein